MDLPSALQKLATYRSHNTRSSQEIFQIGSVVLKSNPKAIKNLGDEGWSFLEQLGLAAIDIGRLDVADQCLQQLSDRFPGSPRVDVLTGIRMEATESPETVLQYYDELLEANAANAAIWKRKISVFRRTGRVEKAVEELSQLLDTFYNDVEGWLELADIYAQWNQYTSALQSLSHLLLLNPQNPFYFLQFAETAYTSGDIPLALKMFLVVIDMSQKEEEERAPEGIVVRAWYGVKLCSRRLLSGASAPSPSDTPVSKDLNLIDELATEKVLAAYSSSGIISRGKGAQGKEVVYTWLGAT